jgi:hypothetical protein
LWGGVAEILGALIEEDAKARNNLLEKWAYFGGREALITAFFDLLKAGVNIFKAFREAVADIFPPMTGRQLVEITEKFGRLALDIRMGTNDLGKFKSIVRGVAAIIDIFFRIIGVGLKVISMLFGGVQLVDGGIWSLLAAVGESIVVWRDWALKMGFFLTLAETIVYHIRNLVAFLKDLAVRFSQLDVVQNVVLWFRELVDSINIDWVRTWEFLLSILRVIIAPFYLLAVSAKNLYAEFRKLGILEDVVGWFNSIDFSRVGTFFNNLREDIGGLFNTIRNSEVLESFLNYINTFDGRRLEQFMSDAEEGFSWIDTIKDSDIFAKIVDGMGSAVEGAKNLAANILDGIKSVFDYLTEDAENLNYETLFDIINTGLLAGFVLAIRKIASGEWISDIIDDSDFGEVFIDTFDRIEGTLGSFQNNIRADTLQKIAVSIAILVGSIWLITRINSEELKVASAAIAIMIATLFGSSGALRTVKPQDAIKASIAVIGLSIALVFMGIALRLISSIDPAEMSNGLQAIGLSLVGLVAATQQLKTGAGIVKSIAVMQGLAIALLAIWGVIKLFGGTDPAVLAIGLTAVGLALTGLTASVAVLSRTGGGKNSSLKAAIAMLAIAKSLDKLHDSVEKFGQMDPKELKQGLETIGKVMLGMSVFTRLVKTDKIISASIAMLIMGAALLVIHEAVVRFGSLNFIQIVVGLGTIAAIMLILVAAGRLMIGTLPAALAMIVMAGAIMILALSLKVLSNLTWEQLALGLVAIGAVLLIFIVAGYLLAPVVPVLIGFGLALFLIGAGAALFGLGIFLAATALTLLAGAFILVAEGIKQFGPALAEELPRLMEAFAVGISGFFVTLAEKAPELKEAFKTLILTAVGGLTEIAPDIALMVATMVTELIGTLLDTIVTLYADITQAGWDLLLEFLGGIEDNIAEMVETALGIIEQFIEGITAGLPDVIAAAVELYFTFLETIEQEVITPENIQRMIDIGLSIAGNIVDGMVKGLANGVGRIVSKVMSLVQAAKDAFSNGMEESSPSKFTYRVGMNTVLGFVNAIRDGIKLAKANINEFVSNVKKQLNPLEQLLADEIDRSLDYSPVITPVIDMGEVNAAAGLIQAAFGGVVIPADLGSVGKAEDVTQDGSGDSSSDSGVTFNQYNYSPKALDRSEIYRQTKTQVALLSNEELR